MVVIRPWVENFLLTMLIGGSALIAVGCTLLALDIVPTWAALLIMFSPIILVVVVVMIPLVIITGQLRSEVRRMEEGS